MACLDGATFCGSEIGKARADQVHIGTFGEQRGEREQVRRYPICGVERNRKPDLADIGFGNAVSAKEIASGVGAIYLEASVTVAIAGRQAEIMEHGRHIKKLGIDIERLSLRCQGSPVVDAGRVFEEKFALCIAHKFSGVTRQRTVWNSDSRYVL